MEASTNALEDFLLYFLFSADISTLKSHFVER